MKVEKIGEVPGNILGMMADLCHKLQHGNRTPKQLELFLKGQNPFAADSPTSVYDWQRFYTKFFGTAFDFSDVKIPGKQPGFDWLIVVAKGFTPNKVFEVCQKHFPCWRYRNDLDKETEGRNDRESKEHYAIWVRSRQEADEELKNLSAEDLKEKGVKGITLLERLLLELWYWKETSEHLDVKNITLCSGSRDSDGDVPGAYWDGGRFRVGWCSPRRDAYPGLRARAAVPCQPKAG